MLAKSQRTQLKNLKARASAPKSELFRLANQIDALSPKQADELRRIAGRLERWITR